MYLVTKPSRPEPRPFAVYSRNVCHALAAIRAAHAAADAKLDAEERREFAAALQLLAIAALAELQLAVVLAE